MGRSHLDHRTALITGGGTGIGREIALALAERGVHVIVAARRSKHLQETVRQIIESGGSATAMTLDLASTESIHELSARLSATLDSLDILINNAGVFVYSKFAEITEREVAALLRTNLFAPILLTKVLLPLLHRSSSAHVVNVASTAPLMELPMMTVYCATKAGLANFSRCLDAELKNEGIRVSTLFPGVTRTALVQPLDHDLVRIGVPVAEAQFVAKEMMKLLDNGKGEWIVSRKQRMLLSIKKWLPWLFRVILSRMVCDMCEIGQHSTVSEVVPSIRHHEEKVVPAP